MKILITGGAGFIGSNFIHHALQKGHAVINIDALTYAGNLENLEGCSTLKNYYFYQTSICNLSETNQILSQHKPDVIVHMAAESHVDRSIDSPDPFIETNIVGTHKLLQAALSYFESMSRPNHFRFLHLSTDEVFGALGKSGYFTESSLYKPNSPYAASKAASDHLVRAYHQTYGLPTLTINCSNNYGPRQLPEKLLPLITLNALEHKPLPIYGTGKQVRDWLYVDDHIDALFLLLEKGSIGETYCIGDDNEMTNLDVVKKICQILDEIAPSSQLKSYEDLITYVTDRPGHDFRYATDSSKLKGLGWSAQTNLDEGLRKTVSWFKDHFPKGRFNHRHRQGLRS